MKSLILLLVLLSAAQPALAVRPGEVSLTAEGTCAYRAIAAQHPDAKLRNPDNLAHWLCRGHLPIPKEYAEARQVIDQSGDQWSGYFYVNARTHYIDDALRQALIGGDAQVVVLGAGFDSRAYRFRASFPSVTFFEVDLPSTIKAKKSRLAEIYGAIPDYVRYAPIDFNTQKLEDVLVAQGYDPSQKTFFILEGVVMYVNDAGNDATFDFIRTRSAPGSTVVYDYILEQVVENHFEGLYGAATTAAGVASIGEPFVSGWTPARAAAFLKKHRMVLVEDVGDKELTKRYMIGSDGKPDGRVQNWLRLIEARVP